jgi:hypothetical protein
MRQCRRRDVVFLKLKRNEGHGVWGWEFGFVVKGGIVGGHDGM